MTQKSTTCSTMKFAQPKIWSMPITCKNSHRNKKMEKNSYSFFLQRLNCCKFISLLSEFTFNYDYDLIWCYSNLFYWQNSIVKIGVFGNRIVSLFSECLPMCFTYRRWDALFLSALFSSHFAAKWWEAFFYVSKTDNLSEIYLQYTVYVQVHGWSGNLLFKHFIHNKYSK